MSPRLLPVAAAGSVLGAAVVLDLRWRRIPDWLTLPSLVVALAGRAVSEGGAGLARAALGALFAAAIAAPLAAWGGVGWDDGKLLAAVGALFGWPWIAGALFAVSLCGAIEAAVALAVAKARARRPAPIPYSVAIAAGSTLAAFLPMFH